MALNIVISMMVIVIGVEAAYPQYDYYWPIICPLEKPWRNCDPNPCLVHKCVAQNAFCEPNHCGGCAVDFFDGNGKHVSYSECYGLDKPGLGGLVCRLKKVTSTCEAHPNALPVCGYFYKYGRRLLPHECKLRKSAEVCESGSKPCKEDPCKLATCNSTSPTVICVPDYCKCTHHFVNQENEKITCGKPIFKPNEIECPRSYKKNVGCKEETCKRICKAFPEAICIHECGSCEPTYYDRKGNKLGRDKCP